jgi:hypothetical protein
MIQHSGEDMIDIPRSALDLERAAEFAEGVTPTTATNYACRNQGNVAKLKKDAATGHVGELAWQLYLSQQGFDVTPVDSKIYQTRQKSWAPDLTITMPCGKLYRVHVKSQDADSARRYGISWTFQLADGRGQIGGRHTDPVTMRKTTTEDDWFAFTVVGDENIRLYAFFPALMAHDRELWRLPKLEHLQRSKVVIYFDILKTLGEDMWSLDKL